MSASSSRRRAGELAETNREHRRAQRVLERLAGAEVGGEREGADHLGRTNRPLRYTRHFCRCAIARRHGDTLLRLRRRVPPRAASLVAG